MRGQTVRRGKFEPDLEALRRNLKKCDDNITTFQEAISKELESKAELRRMIEEIERRQRNVP